MSRLKGADLGIVITNPTLASLGGAKNTIGAGLPSFIGRLPGDGHYDSTAKVFYVLTGAASVSLSDTFNRASLGTTLESGQTAIVAGTSPSISSNHLVGSPAIFGGDVGASYSTTGGFVQADFFRGASSDQFELHLGSSDPAGSSSGGWRFVISSTVAELIDPTGNPNGMLLNPFGGGFHDVGTTHTWTLQVIGGVAKLYKDGGLVATSGTSTQGGGTKATTVISSSGGGYADNLSAQSNGTLAWTAVSVAGALNYRGAWTASPSPTYAVNDVVSRNGMAYAANALPGSVDPASPPAAVTADSFTGTSPGGLTVTSLAVAQIFTQTASVTVDTVSIAENTTAHWSGTVTVALVAGAIANGADAAAAAPLATASAPATSFANGVQLQLPLSVAVALTAGQQYTLVITGSAGGNIGTIQVQGTPGTPTGITLGTLRYASTASTVLDSTLAGFGVDFRLIKAIPPWTPLAPTVENVNVVAASGSAVTLPDVTTATMHRITLTAATPAITLPAPGAGKSFTVELVQDATGGRAPTWVTPSGAIRWPGGTAPTITAAANAIDVITFACIGGTNWYGFVAGQAFA